MEFAENQYSQLEAVFSSSSPAVFGRPGAKIQTVPAAPAQALPGPAKKFLLFLKLLLDKPGVPMVSYVLPTSCRCGGIGRHRRLKISR